MVLVYRELLAIEWIPTAVIAAVWIHDARPWRLIGLVPPVDWRLVLTMALATALTILFRAQLYPRQSGGSTGQTGTG